MNNDKGPLRGLEQAHELRRQGKLDEATRLCEDVVKSWPRVFEALHLLGILQYLQGRNAEALRFLEAAVAERPFDVAALSNLGLVHAMLGHPGEALGFYDRALAIMPDFPEALTNRCHALIELGQPLEALASCVRVLTLRPNDIAGHYHCGNALTNLNRPAEALACYERALALDPDLVDALSNRGNALVDLKRPAEALKSCERALELMPNHAAALMHRGNALMALGRPADALASYDRVVTLRPGVAETLLNRGNALRELNRSGDALADYDQAIALKPGLAEAHFNRGIILTDLGRLDDANEALEFAIKLQPRRIRFYHSLTDTRRMAQDDPHIATMQAMAQHMASLSSQEQIELNFALGKTLADIGEHERSFAYLHSGNAAKRQEICYDEAATLRLLDRTRVTLSKDLIRRQQGSGDPSAVPVFVIGMPRSGTTLVEQILSSHPKVHGAGEIDDFEHAIVERGGETGKLASTPEIATSLSAEHWLEIGQAYVARLRSAAPWAARICNKTPENFRLVGLIHLTLPNAILIHVRRDPIDTCLSCFSQLFAQGNLAYTYSLEELGRYYRAYTALMAHWRSILPNGVMLDVDYEDVVADLEGQARRILAHCRLDWSPRCLEFHRTKRAVRTASMSQVRQPIYHSSVGRARVHFSRLQPLFDALGMAPPNQSKVATGEEGAFQSGILA